MEEASVPLLVCLHKDHDEWWDITRFVDQVYVYVAPCGGVRYEARD